MCAVSSECILRCLQTSIHLVATVEGFVDHSIDWCGDRVQDCRHDREKASRFHNPKVVQG